MARPVKSGGGQYKLRLTPFQCTAIMKTGRGQSNLRLTISTLLEGLGASVHQLVLARPRQVGGCETRCEDALPLSSTSVGAHRPDLKPHAAE